MGHVGSFRVIGLCDAWTQQSTIIFTDKSSTSRVQIPSFAIVKAKLGLNNVYVLADSNNEICPLVDLSDTIPFPIFSKHSTNPRLSKPYRDKKTSPYTPSICKMTSKRPPLHIAIAMDGLSILDALRETYPRKIIQN